MGNKSHLDYPVGGDHNVELREEGRVFLTVAAVVRVDRQRAAAQTLGLLRRTCKQRVSHTKEVDRCFPSFRNRSMLYKNIFVELDRLNMLLACESSCFRETRALELHRPEA